MENNHILFLRKDLCGEQMFIIRKLLQIDLLLYNHVNYEMYFENGGTLRL